MLSSILLSILAAIVSVVVFFAMPFYTSPNVPAATQPAAVAITSAPVQNPTPSENTSLFELVTRSVSPENNTGAQAVKKAATPALAEASAPTQREIATSTGVSLSTLDDRLNQTVIALRSELQRSTALLSTQASQNYAATALSNRINQLYNVSVSGVSGLTSSDIPSLSYLPLSGGTLSGAFSGTTGTFTGAITGTTGSFSGNVGIGTTTPYSRLSVWGTGTGTNRLFELTNSASTTLASMLENGTAYFAVNVGIGNTAPVSRLDITNSATSTPIITLRDPLGNVSLELRAGTSTLKNTFVGVDAGRVNTTGASNVAIGYQSLYSNTGGALNTATGYKSLYANTTGVYNSVYGDEAAVSNISGLHNTVLGAHALELNTAGNYNSILGSFAFQNGTGSSNIAIGVQAGLGVTTGSGNIIIGTSLLGASYNQVTTGSNNISIGTDAAVASSTASNQLSIGNLIYGTGLDGTGTTLSTGNVGIGTTTPAYKLTINSSNATDNLFQVATTTNQNIFTVNSAGQVGIGTTPASVWGVDVKNGHLVFRNDVTAPTSTCCGGLPESLGIGFPAAGGGGVSLGAIIDSEINGVWGVDIRFATLAPLGGSLGERMRVTAGGNVGIGETVPGSKLSVSGGGSFGSGYDTTAAPTNGLLVEGNVGIGTTSPYSLLSISNSAGTAANTPLFTIASTTGGTSTSTLMTVLASGNVGIGTTTPAYKLTVNSSNATDNLFQVATTTNQGIMVIDSQGHVGFGTTPSVMGGG